MNKAAFCRGLGLAQNPTAPRISKRIKIEIKKDYEKIKKISVWSNTLWNADQKYIDNYMSTYPGYYQTYDAGHIDDDG